MQNKKVINYEKLKERMLVIASSVSIAMSFASCSVTRNLRNGDNSSFTGTLSEETMETTESTLPIEADISTTDTTLASETTNEIKPTGFEAYIGETVPTIEYNAPKDMTDFSISTKTHEMSFLGKEFGFDNPKLKRNLQEYLGVSDVNFYDVGYFQEEYSTVGTSDYFPFKDYQDFEGQNVECQIAMYILQNLGRRLYVDEIPYEFFAANFPDLLDMLDVELHSDDSNLHTYGQDVLWLDYSQDEIFKFTLARTMDEIKSNLGTPNDVEILRRLIFSSAFRYNQTRCGLAYNYRHTGDYGENFKAVYIPQVRTADGRNVLLFDQRNYDIFMDDLHDQDCYKHIVDLYAPLTEDDLVKGGIDMDEFKYVIEDVTGVTFDLDYSKDGDSRSRSS